MKIQAPEVSFCQQSGFNTASSHPVGAHNTQMPHEKRSQIPQIFRVRMKGWSGVLRILMQTHERFASRITNRPSAQSHTHCGAISPGFHSA
jgi:hypothetical protein